MQMLYAPEIANAITALYFQACDAVEIDLREVAEVLVGSAPYARF